MDAEQEKMLNCAAVLDQKLAGPENRARCRFIRRGSILVKFLPTLPAGERLTKV
jgi:hypothetical protein